MDEFDRIAQETITESFHNLTKAVESLGEAGRNEYANKFPVAIFLEASVDNENMIAFSAN